MTEKLWNAGFNLMPNESKKLIGMAICSMPRVKKAFEDGIVYVKSQTTSYWILKTMMEWAGLPDMPKDNYVCGMNTPLGTCHDHTRSVLHWDRLITRAKGEKAPPLVMPQYVFEKGEAVCIQDNADPWVFKMGKDDIYIGGANAIDPNGEVAIQCWGGAVGTAEKPRGGTIQRHLPFIEKHMIPHLIAVGLEKMITNTIEQANYAAPMMNIPKGRKHPRLSGEFIYFDGPPMGLLPIKKPPAEVISEIEAIKILTGCDAVQYGGGGVCGAEGSVQLVVTGTKEQINKAIDLRAGQIGFSGNEMPNLRPPDHAMCPNQCLHARQWEWIDDSFKKTKYAKEGWENYPWLTGAAAKYRAKPVFDPQKDEKITA